MRPESAARVSLPRAGGAGGLLASHDARSLAELLERAGGTPSAARSAAGRALRHVFASSATSASPAPPWDEATLRALGVGAWAHAALLSLDVAPSLGIADEAPSTDDTVRMALRARDGALLETVLIPGPNRTTVCLSSQVGCARACTFCETGRLGLARQLEAGEMIDQVRLARCVWRARGGATPLSNLVFMGMGEPFDNLGEVARAPSACSPTHAPSASPPRASR